MRGAKNAARGNFCACFFGAKFFGNFLAASSFNRSGRWAPPKRAGGRREKTSLPPMFLESPARSQDFYPQLFRTPSTILDSLTRPGARASFRLTSSENNLRAGFLFASRAVDLICHFGFGF